MRIVAQRVSSAEVTVDGCVVGQIEAGLVILLGIHRDDTPADALWLAGKMANLRIFEDAGGKMNLSLLDLATQNACSLDPTRPTALVVSQFTLLAGTNTGNRPSFNEAAPPALAKPLYELFNVTLERLLGRPVATGQFGAMMRLALVNTGPVTLQFDSRARGQ